MTQTVWVSAVSAAGLTVVWAYSYDSRPLSVDGWRGVSVGQRPADVACVVLVPGATESGHGPTAAPTRLAPVRLGGGGGGAMCASVNLLFFSG